MPIARTTFIFMLIQMLKAPVPEGVLLIQMISINSNLPLHSTLLKMPLLHPAISIIGWIAWTINTKAIIIILTIVRMINKNLICTTPQHNTTIVNQSILIQN